MRALGTSVWGQIGDRIADIAIPVAALIGLLVRNGWSWKRIVEGRAESFAIAVTALALLVIWHAFTSAHAVSVEVRSEHQVHGFGEQAARIPFARTKLYGMAICLMFLSIATSYFFWAQSINSTVSSTATPDKHAAPPDSQPHPLPEQPPTTPKKFHETSKKVTEINAREGGLALARNMKEWLKEKEGDPKETDIWSDFSNEFGGRIVEFRDTLLIYGLKSTELDIAANPNQRFYSSPPQAGVELVAKTVGDLSQWLPAEKQYKDISDFQLGNMAIGEADRVNNKVQQAIHDMSQPLPGANGVRALFYFDYQECCLEAVRDIRGVIVKRLGPTATDADEMEDFSSLMGTVTDPERSSGTIAAVLAYAPYLKQLGVSIRDRKVQK